MKTLRGVVSIARLSGGKRGNLIHIEFGDKDSGCLAARVEMGLAEFALALTGRLASGDVGFANRRCV